MQCTGRECYICGNKIIAEKGTSGCGVCDIAMHDACLEDPSRCPSCGRPFVEEEQVVEQPPAETEASGGFFGPEKKGIKAGAAGGLLMMAIAVVWFVVGYAAGYIFFYPPILFLIGVYALIKGLATGNIAGDK